MASPTLECVVNLSEGRNHSVLDRLAASCADTLIDRHSDGDHHRSVFTLAGPAPTVETSVRGLTSLAVELIDLTDHAGVHPRFGAVDVVPFVPLGSHSLAPAVEARDRFAEWAGEHAGPGACTGGTIDCTSIECEEGIGCSSAFPGCQTCT